MAIKQVKLTIKNLIDSQIFIPSLNLFCIKLKYYLFEIFTNFTNIESHKLLEITMMWRHLFFQMALLCSLVELIL